jgi:hypothetical protein
VFYLHKNRTTVAKIIADCSLELSLQNWRHEYLLEGKVIDAEERISCGFGTFRHNYHFMVDLPLTLTLGAPLVIKQF